MLTSVQGLDIRPVRVIAEQNGTLLVAESGRDVPFAFPRVFAVTADAGAVRGRHAHRACSQFLVAATGKVEVLCDDGRATRAFALDRPDRGLLLPPGIWATLAFHVPHTVLLVLCDRPFDESDYIRDHGAFLAWRRAGGGAA